jgi:hypothetical protein
VEAVRDARGRLLTPVQALQQDLAEQAKASGSSGDL